MFAAVEGTSQNSAERKTREAKKGGGRIAPADVTDMNTSKEKVKAVFFSFGSREGGAASARANADALKQAGINSYYYESPLTAHEWQSWRRSLHQFAPLLFKK